MSHRLKIDDVVDAIPVRLVAGCWGRFIVAWTNDGASFGTQIMGFAAIGAFVFVVSYVLFTLIKLTMGLRVGEDEELGGLAKRKAASGKGAAFGVLSWGRGLHAGLGDGLSQDRNGCLVQARDVQAAVAHHVDAVIFAHFGDLFRACTNA